MSTLEHVAKHTASNIANFVAALVIKYLLNVVHGCRSLLSHHIQGGLQGDWVGNSCVVDVHFRAL